MNSFLEQCKFQRFNLRQQEIKQVFQVNHGQKLAELGDGHETLQVELPNIFQNLVGKRSKQEEIKQANELQHINLNKSAGKHKKTIHNSGTQQTFFKRSSQLKTTFYALVKMMFPQVQGIPPLNIDLMDTIFYNPDGSLTYIYTDRKKGLLKTKSKNYIEMFLKRKAEVQNGQQISLTKIERKYSEANPKNSVMLPNKYYKSQYLKQMNYVALLRYKDENFIRLKQHEFKSIFIRPVQANQKYKIFNNTHYMQLIPQQVNYEQGTLFNIQFILDKHKQTQLFQKAVQIHEEQTSYNKLKQSFEIKKQIQKSSIQAYLLYIVFQIYSYINIHYHKQILYGVFQFMKVRECYYLSNGRKIRINDSENIKNQYAKGDLFEQFVQIDENFNLSKYKQNNQLINLMSTLFDKQNKKICEQVRQKVTEQIEGIQNRLDTIQSNYIFSSINDKCPHKLHFLLQNQAQFSKFLRQKQRQLDGLSPLTSISNISRKKFRKQTKQQLVKDEKKQLTKINLNKNSNNCFDLFDKIQYNKRSEHLFSKWYKQGLNGKKQYIIEKR